MNKYELTTETLRCGKSTLHRIKALKDFGSIKAGELGGWIESEENLSQDGNAWVRDNAKVYEYAKVYGEAVICDNARIRGNARVFDNAMVCDKANVFGNAWVHNEAKVRDRAGVFGNAWVYGNAELLDDATVFSNAEIFGNAKLCDNALVYGFAKVGDKAEIGDKATICDKAEIKGNAKVHNSADYIVFKNFWSGVRYFTWTRSNNKWSDGCFYGTGKELIKEAYADSEISGREYERVVRYVEGILADEKKGESN